jgi:hypothetical protein
MTARVQLKKEISSHEPQGLDAKTNCLASTASLEVTLTSVQMELSPLRLQINLGNVLQILTT